MSRYVRRVPRTSIRRLAVYENVKRLPLSKIVEEQQPDLAISGGFYNKQWKSVCPVKADGKVLYADTQYNYWALAWDEGADAGPELILPGGVSEKKNYIANCVLVTGGSPRKTLYYNADVGGKRGRTAVGLTEDDGLFLFASDDGTADACTPEQLRETAAEEGCYFALMLDGGRKVNFYDRRDGTLLEGKDPSQNLLLLWLSETETDGDDVKTYSVQRDGDMKLSANFRVREFACNDGSDTVLISDKLTALLQKIRDRFGAAVAITSGYRTAEHNARVGGSARSQHLLGTAADIVVAGADPLEVARYAEFLQPSAGGIGVYQTFTHVDVREKRTRWDSRGGTEQSVDGWPGYSEKPEAEQAVEWAAAQGILPENEAGSTALDEPLTRRQAVVLLYRQAKRNGKT